MSIIIDKSKSERVLEFFLGNPTEKIHLRSLARRLKISATWASKTVKGLARKGLLVIVKSEGSGQVNIQAERDNPVFKRMKICFNLKKIYESGILDELIRVYGRPEAIILFGSYSKGEDIENSDIDIAVIGIGKRKINLTRFEKMLDQKINLLELRKEKIEDEFMNTLANGVVLYGYLDIRK